MKTNNLALLLAVFLVISPAGKLSAQEIKEYTNDPVVGEAKGLKNDEQSKKVENDINRQIGELKKKMLNRGPMFSLAGKVEKGIKSKYSINGEDFSVHPDAVITGEFRIGNYAQVDGPLVNGQKNATAINAAETNNYGGIDAAPPTSELATGSLMQ